MKKLLVLLLIILSFNLIGCTTKTDDTTNKWKDGTYTAEGDEWDYGSENSTVVIEDGRMTEITLRRLDKTGTEVDYETWTGQEIDGKVYPNLKQYKEDMAKKMIDKQSTDVDSIAGATVSSDNWKVATKRALDKAK